MSQKFDGNILVVGLDETYDATGEYSFKIVLNPYVFKNSHGSKIGLFDANGAPIDMQVKKWGRKICCDFIIGSESPNGVYMVKLESGKVEEMIKFWVIK